MQTLDVMCLHTVGWRLPGSEPAHSQPLLGLPAWYQVVLSWHGQLPHVTGQLSWADVPSSPMAHA